MNPEVAYASLLESSAAVGQVVLISMLLERALSFVFEYHWIAKLIKAVEGLKSPITFAFALIICRQYGLDIMAELFRAEGSAPLPTTTGYVITAAIIGGGSAGAMSLFQSVFKWNRDSRNAGIEANKINAEALVAEAKARKANAEKERKLAEAE